MTDRLRDDLDTFAEEHGFQQWAFRELQQQTKHKAELAGIVAETVEPSYTSRQCSKCGTILDENRTGQHFECLDCRPKVGGDDRERY